MTTVRVRPSRRQDRLGLRIFVGGQVTSLMGDGLALLAIPLLVLSLTRNPVTAALSAAPRTIGYVVAGMPAGVIVDRLNPRYVMMSMDVVRFTIFALLAVLGLNHLLRVWIVLALAFVAAGAGVFFETALAVAVRDMVGDDRLLGVNSALELANQLSIIVGPGIVGILAATIGLMPALLVNAGTFVVSLVTLFAVRRSGHQIAPTAGVWRALRRMRADLVEGLGYLRAEPLILMLALLSAGLNLFLAAETLQVFFGKQLLRLDDVQIGVVVMAGGAGGIVAALSTPLLGRRFAEPTLIVAGGMATALSLVAVGLAQSMPTLALANLVSGLASVVSVIAIRSLRQRLVPRELLGRTTGTARMIALSAGPLGTLLAGILTSLNGGNPRPVFIGAGLLALLLVTSVWLGFLRPMSIPAAGGQPDLTAPLDRVDDPSGWEQP